MIKGAIASMARYVNVPSAAVPLAQSPRLRFLAAAQPPLHLHTNASSLQNSVCATHSLSSWAPLTHPGGGYDSSRPFPDQWSVRSCHSAAPRAGIPSRYPELRRAAWLAQAPIQLPRGFASSAKDAEAGAPAAAPAAVPEPGLSDGVNTSSGTTADSLANAAESVKNAVNSLVESSRDAAGKMFPSVDNWMDPSGGGVAELVVPVTTSICVSLVAWLLLPKVLRKLHSYVEAGPTARLLGRLPQEKQPYELSVFSALDMPLRFLATTITFSYLGYIVAPTSIGVHYLTQIWSGATVISAIWFLYRWKSNVFARMLTGKTITNPERERYLTMDRLSSIGLFILGGMAFAEACGVAVQSILTVGGIGGVATAFAARDILGNMLSGVSLQFSRPFTIGDSIAVGSLSGQVVEMGLHTTQLLNSEKFPVVVPNSFFSNQVIVNKSRALYRAYSFNIPVHIQDLEKVPVITSEIRRMMFSHPKVYLENEKPRCFVTQVGPSSLNIAVSCNLKPMGTDDYLSTGEGLLIESARLVAKTGATLGTPA